MQVWPCERSVSAERACPQRAPQPLQQPPRRSFGLFVQPTRASDMTVSLQPGGTSACDRPFSALVESNPSQNGDQSHVSARHSPILESSLRRRNKPQNCCVAYRGAVAASMRGSRGRAVTCLPAGIAASCGFPCCCTRQEQRHRVHLGVAVVSRMTNRMWLRTNVMHHHRCERVVGGDRESRHVVRCGDMRLSGRGPDDRAIRGTRRNPQGGDRQLQLLHPDIAHRSRTSGRGPARVQSTAVGTLTGRESRCRVDDPCALPTLLPALLRANRPTRYPRGRASEAGVHELATSGYESRSFVMSFSTMFASSALAAAESFVRSVPVVHGCRGSRGGVGLSALCYLINVLPLPGVRCRRKHFPRRRLGLCRVAR